MTRRPYLKEAGRFLGHLDARHIDLRGEAFARFATQFDVIDRFKIDPARSLIALLSSKT